MFTTISTYEKHKYVSSFHPEKCYIMIGCLGGLGRTLARWMVNRGARKFAFLGRSGLQKSAARNLIEDLDLLSVKSVVISGDICNDADWRLSSMQPQHWVRLPRRITVQVIISLTCSLATSEPRSYLVSRSAWV